MGGRHIGCGCGQPSTTAKTNPCVRICEPLQITQGGDWKLAKATTWNSFVVETMASATGMGLLTDNPNRKETIFRVKEAVGWVYVGFSKDDVEAGKGYPMKCGETFISEGYTGPFWIATESGEVATVSVNEVNY